MTTTVFPSEDTAVQRDLDPVRSVLSDSCRRLLAEQQSDGTWHGAIMYNAWTNGMHCILLRILGVAQEPTAALNWLEEHRTGLDDDGEPNGTWGVIDIPSAAFLEGTIAAEIALEVWGRGRREEPWAYIDSQAVGRLTGAIGLADPFTQLFAALAGPYAPEGHGPYYDVRQVLAPPLMLLMVPRVFKASFPHLAGAWGQDAMVALTAVAGIVANRRINLAERALLKKAEAHLLTTQNEDGSWYDTFLPTIACTLAMHYLGYGLGTKVMSSALGFLSKLERWDGYVARYKLPVWDTTIAVLALTTAGVSGSSPQLREAGEYLLSCSTPTGGIPFQRENVRYPDCDDTAYAIIALDRIDMGEREAEKARVIAKAVRWTIYMQGDDGGWAAFAKNQADSVRGLLPVFKDDPATADVTGHVLSGLAPLLAEPKQSVERIAGAISWLERMQLDDGSWFGRWGLTFGYGTAAVLIGLRDVAGFGPGARLPDAAVNAAVDYLLSTQRDDGGWGEGYVTYYDFNAVDDSVTSTVEQTAWTVLGLLAAPANAKTEQAIERGVDFLLAHYDPAQGWPEAGYTVGAIWVYRNSLYPLLWATWALAEYVKVKTAEQESQVAAARAAAGPPTEPETERWPGSERQPENEERPEDEQGHGDEPPAGSSGEREGSE
ncbi:hypothetical protein ACPZ19_46185 [Amycolatopsis lurida]